MDQASSSAASSPDELLYGALIEYLKKYCSLSIRKDALLVSELVSAFKRSEEFLSFQSSLSAEDSLDASSLNAIISSVLQTQVLGSAPGFEAARVSPSKSGKGVLAVNLTFKSSPVVTSPAASSAKSSSAVDSGMEDESSAPRSKRPRTAISASSPTAAESSSSKSSTLVNKKLSRSSMSSSKGQSSNAKSSSSDKEKKRQQKQLEQQQQQAAMMSAMMPQSMMSVMGPNGPMFYPTAAGPMFSYPTAAGRLAPMALPGTTFRFGPPSNSNDSDSENSSFDGEYDEDEVYSGSSDDFVVAGDDDESDSAAEESNNNTQDSVDASETPTSASLKKSSKKAAKSSSAPAWAYLISQNSARGRIIAVRGDRFSIGTSAECDFVLFPELHSSSSSRRSSKKSSSSRKTSKKSSSASSPSTPASSAVPAFAPITHSGLYCIMSIKTSFPASASASAPAVDDVSQSVNASTRVVIQHVTERGILSVGKEQQAPYHECSLKSGDRLTFSEGKHREAFILLKASDVDKARKEAETLSGKTPVKKSYGDVSSVPLPSPLPLRLSAAIPLSSSLSAAAAADSSAMQVESEDKKEEASSSSSSSASHPERLTISIPKPSASSSSIFPVIASESSSMSKISADAYQEFTSVLKSMIVKPETNELSLERFPYHLNADTKSVLLDNMYALLKKKDAISYLTRATSTSDLRRMQWIAPEGTELFVEQLASAVAKHFNVNFLCFDFDKLVLPPPPTNVLDDDAPEISITLSSSVSGRHSSLFQKMAQDQDDEGFDMSEEYEFFEDGEAEIEASARGPNQGGQPLSDDDDDEHKGGKVISDSTSERKLVAGDRVKCLVAPSSPSAAAAAKRSKPTYAQAYHPSSSRRSSRRRGPHADFVATTNSDGEDDFDHYDEVINLGQPGVIGGDLDQDMMGQGDHGKPKDRVLIGPQKGAIGTIILALPENPRWIGVRFDKKVIGGHSLCGLCEEGHGFLMLRSSVKFEDEEANTVSKTCINALFDVIEYCKPCLVLIKKMESSIVEHDIRYQVFKKRVESMSEDVLLIGTYYSNAATGASAGDDSASSKASRQGSSSSNPSNIDRIMAAARSGDSASVLNVSLSAVKLNKRRKLLFPNRISLPPPSDSLAVEKWRQQLKTDRKTMIREANRDLFRRVMREKKLFYSDDAAGVPSSLFNNVDSVYKWSQAERVLNMAINHQLRLADAATAKQEEKPAVVVEAAAAAAAAASSEKMEEDTVIKQEKFDEVQQASSSSSSSSSSDVVIVEKPKEEAKPAVATPIVVPEGFMALSRASIEHSVKLQESINNTGSKVANSLRDVMNTLTEEESNLAHEVISPENINVSFDDVAALDKVKDILMETVMLPLKRPELFRRGNLAKPVKGILLFGPPGNGKTMIAKAVAKESGANFISIGSSNVTSEWYGVGEKMMRAVFTLASKISPCVVFVDEIDSLMAQRGHSGEHEATRRMINEFMSGWDGLKTKENERVLVLGATNRPFDLDDAVLRRMPRRVLVDMPNADAREKMLKVTLRDEELVPGFDMHKLAEKTENYSGSDLRNVCKAAAYMPVKEILAAEKAKLKAREEAKASGKAEDMEIENSKASNEEHTLRPLKMEDFEQALKDVKPSVHEDSTSISELRRWNDQYGEGGSGSAKSKHQFLYT